MRVNQSRAKPETGKGSFSISDDPLRKRILIMGSNGAGKTSCMEVVFKGMLPKNTFFLDPTNRVNRLDVNTIIPFQLWDCPGNHQVENLVAPLSAFSSLVYVIDLQDEYGHAVNQFIHLMAIVHEMNRDLHIEVFAHKAESLAADYGLESFSLLQERVYIETIDHPLPLQDMRVTFHLTSVYDHTIFEAWSRIIQKLVKPLATLENLLNVLCSNSGLTKAFLFDVKTLIHVAADESPPDPTMYGLCCDYVQTIQQFSVLYKNVKFKPSEKNLDVPQSLTPHTFSRPLIQPQLSSSSQDSQPKSFVEVDPEDSRVWQTSCVRLRPQTTMAYWQISRQLSLVALIRTDTYESSQSEIDYNVTFFRKAVHRIVDMENVRWYGGDDVI